MRHLLFLLLILAGCSRHVESEPLPDATFSFGPTAKDSALEINPLSPAERSSRLELRSTNLRSADYLRVVDELTSLARIHGDDRIHDFAAKLYAAFRSAQPNGVAVADSLYADAAIGEGEAVMMPFLSSTDTILRSAISALGALLNRSQKDFPWPKRVGTFEQAIGVADSYVSWVETRLPNIGLDPKIDQAIQAALDQEFGKYRAILVKAARGFEASRNFAQDLQVVDYALHALTVPLRADQVAIVAQAHEFSRQLSEMETPQDTLATIIYVWRLIPPPQKAQLKSASPELYDFLSGKSDADLNCLSGANACLNPVMLVEKLVVRGKIEKLGVQVIRDKIAAAAHGFVASAIIAELNNQIPRVPALARQKLNEAGGRYISLLAAARKDFGGFTRSRMRSWAARRFPVPLRGLETEALNVEVLSTSSMAVSAAPSISRSGAEILGLSLSVAPNFLPADLEARKAAIVEPLLKLLSMGGFRQLGGQPFPGLFLALDGKPSDVFNIRSLLGGEISYAVPDHFMLTRGFTLDRGTAPKNASVGAQAELLRGIAREVRQLRDWETSEVDTVLGSFNAGELVPEVPTGTFSYPMFPKPMLFALAVGNAGAILQNMIRHLSPAFLYLREGEILWGDRYKEIQGANVSTVAGLVPIIDGKRAGFVRTGDVARYVLALDEFIAATEGVENTQSPPLLEKDKEGATVLSQLVSARADLRLLQMALTNYLVTISQGSGGVHAAQRSIPNLLSITAEAPRLEDQALAIRALIASSRSLSIPVFTWAALDTFYGMNRTFFDAKTGFYSDTTKPSGLHEVALTLLAGAEIEPFLPPASRAQWRKISAPWLDSLREF